MSRLRADFRACTTTNWLSCICTRDRWHICTMS